MNPRTWRSTVKGFVMAKNPTARWLLLSPFLVAACTLSLILAPIPSGVRPQAFVTASPTHLRPAATIESTVETPGAIQTTLPEEVAKPTPFCEDPRPLTLIETFRRAIGWADGALLSSLVSPQHGLDARLLRDGRVVNYDQPHAAALFESTYVVDWGNSPGSGLPIKGSFRDLFVPDLEDLFSKSYTTTCNQIQVGGTTYTVKWPYEGIDFYSLHYPGSAGYGSLDWHTWVIGMHVVDERIYLYAIMQFKWEP